MKISHNQNYTHGSHIVFLKIFSTLYTPTSFNIAIDFRVIEKSFFFLYNKVEFNTTAQWNSSFSLPSSDIRYPQNTCTVLAPPWVWMTRLTFPSHGQKQLLAQFFFAWGAFPCSGVHKKLIKGCMKWLHLFVHDYCSWGQLDISYVLLSRSQASLILKAYVVPTNRWLFSSTGNSALYHGRWGTNNNTCPRSCFLGEQRGLTLSVFRVLRETTVPA